MKTILTYTTWFAVTFVVIAVLTSAMAAEPIKKPPTPPADCSCGACE